MAYIFQALCNVGECSTLVVGGLLETNCKLGVAADVLIAMATRLVSKLLVCPIVLILNPPDIQH